MHPATGETLRARSPNLGLLSTGKPVAGDSNEKHSLELSSVAIGCQPRQHRLVATEKHSLELSSVAIGCQPRQHRLVATEKHSLELSSVAIGCQPRQHRLVATEKHSLELSSVAIGCQPRQHRLVATEKHSLELSSVAIGCQPRQHRETCGDRKDPQSYWQEMAAQFLGIRREVSRESPLESDRKLIANQRTRCSTPT